MTYIKDKKMKKEDALRVDGMLIGTRGELDSIAFYIKNNFSEEDSRKFLRSIGEAMSAIMDISMELYSEFPDIIPAELRPQPPESA